MPVPDPQAPSPASTKPVHGRTVHFLPENLSFPERSAVISRVVNDDGVVDLTVFDPDQHGGTYVARSVPCASPALEQPGSWHWPERV